MLSGSLFLPATFGFGPRFAMPSDSWDGSGLVQARLYYLGQRQCSFARRRVVHRQTGGTDGLRALDPRFFLQMIANGRIWVRTEEEATMTRRGRKVTDEQL